MKTKIKRHGRSILSVILALSMLVSCMMVGLIASDAAKVKDEAVGYSNVGYVKGDWDDWKTPDDSKGHNITNGYTVSLQANKTYEFVFVADNSDVFKKDVTISTTVTDYDFNKDATQNAKLKTTVAGDYTFQFVSVGDSSMRVNITFPTASTNETWSVAGGSGGVTTGGQSDPLFTQTWNTTLTQNDMTKTSDTTWTWTKNNVTLADGKILCKVVKDHSWDTAYPASGNKEFGPLVAGQYNVTITFNSSTKAVTITATQITKSTLTVGSNANATITATYNGTSATNGGTISNIPQGATVNITVAPSTGYQCTEITSSGGGSISGSINSYTLKMPGSATTVNATITTVTLKKIYFNNNYTQYSTVYAYVYNKDGDSKTYEYLGARPGKVMRETDNTEMWYIEVPSNINYVEFISGDGKSTGELTIPWSNANPKYTAPYNYNAPTVANGGAWGNYKWGDKVGDQRDNVYNVTNGSTMGASNLFTGISGTLFDYYVDDEVNGSWLTNLADHTANYSNSGLTSNDPYKKLNANLSAYADADKTSSNADWSNPSQPKYGITYPLYFGNLNVDAGNTLVSGYYDFVKKANNSNGLTHNYNAVTGLSGNKLGDDNTIHYYKNGATGENGAPMAMFNEDFLSGENKTGETLATILRTSFPVRKETSVKSLCLDLSSATSWEGTGYYIVANFYNNNTTDASALRLPMTPIGNHKYHVEVPSGYTKVEWLKFTSSDIYGSAAAWNNAGEFSSWNTFKSNSADKNAGGTTSIDSTLAAGHEYYEYDSTDGKDNAFITNINTSNKTANIDYYNSASGKYVQSAEKGTKGFFPFDYNNIIKSGNTYPTDILYLDITGFTGGASYWAHFFDGGTAVDKKMTQVSGNIYQVENPGGLNKVTFTRNSNSSAPDSTWSNVWNETDDLNVPNGSSNEVLYEVTGYNKSKKNGKGVDGSWQAKTDIQPYPNNYADPSTHNAHDQGFGMKLEIPFTLAANGLNTDGTHQTFNFSGDDDLWVFVDGKLVLDLGGAHAKTTGSIDFNTKTVTAVSTQAIGTATRNGSFADGFNTNPNYVHTMTIYYMERGMLESNLKFGFSFHAIPNQFWIDKKIRTKDKNNLGHDTINAGFFTNNNQTGDASNMTTHTLGEKTTTMSKFEKSFQNESFTVTHYYGASTPDTSAAGKKYTIDYNDQTQTVNSNGQYPIYHDKGNAFIAQFTTNDKFKLKETISSSNKYVYIPEFSVWDQANNDTAITPGGNNTDGYTFDFSPTNPPTSGGIENTNIKARFENYMVAHDLILTKELTNTTDTTSEFTFQILFDFTGTTASPNYVSYPLYCDVDGVRTQLSDEGTIKVKAGQVIDIFEIPENAKVQITELLTDSVSGYRYNGITLKKGSTNVTPTKITKGIQFQMGDADMSAVVANKKPDNKYTITYIYPSYGESPKTKSLYGDQSYTVSGVFTEEELKSYMVLSGSSIVFKDAAAKRTFINNKAPYEDNFMQKLSFAQSDIVETDTGWDANGDYSCSVTATGTADYTISAYFNLPYEVDGSLVPKESGTTKKIVYKSSKTAYGQKDLTCFDWYVTGGPTNKSQQQSQGGTPVFVNAPLIVYEDVNNENTKKYFQYWSVKSQSGYGKQSAEYTRCYDYEFNLALFMDCIIEPVYANKWAQTLDNPNPPATYNDYKRYNPEIQIQGDGINIAFLENSRNQYNNNGGGSRNGSAADVIYSDFLLNFNYNSTDGLVQLNTLEANTKKAGLVVEAVDYMQYESGSTGVFDYDKNYSGESKYKANETTQMAAIKNWLQGDADKPTGCANAQFDVKKLDNKNCIQYYYALNNRMNNDGILLNTLQNRYKVFRAYAYIGNVNGNKLTDVKLSTPVYFTIYDVGSQGLADNATIS